MWKKKGGEKRTTNKIAQPRFGQGLNWGTAVKGHVRRKSA